MYRPSHIANFMLDRAFAEDRQISPMKLIKLVYIAYGWGLAALDKKLFEELIYAWQHGPVIESLYHEFKSFRASAITTYSVVLDLDTIELTEPRIDRKQKDENFILGIVWDIYKRYSATALRNKTHELGTPWQKVYRREEQSIVIPDELIKEHFTIKIGEYLSHASSKPRG